MTAPICQNCHSSSPFSINLALPLRSYPFHHPEKKTPPQPDWTVRTVLVTCCSINTAGGKHRGLLYRSYSFYHLASAQISYRSATTTAALAKVPIAPIVSFAWRKGWSNSATFRFWNKSLLWSVSQSLYIFDAALSIYSAGHLTSWLCQALRNIPTFVACEFQRNDLILFMLNVFVLPLGF